MRSRYQLHLLLIILAILTLAWGYVLAALAAVPSSDPAPPTQTEEFAYVVRAEPAPQPLRDGWRTSLNHLRKVALNPTPVFRGAAAFIAQCESEGRNVKNPASSASGYFQFLDSTWEWVTGLEPPAMAYSAHVQREAFWTLWDNGRGSFHWNPSKHCWADYL